MEEKMLKTNEEQSKEAKKRKYWVGEYGEYYIFPTKVLFGDA